MTLTRSSSTSGLACCLAWLVLASATAHAQFDPARATREAPGVAAQFAEPAVRYATPAFREGRTDLTSHAEAMAFLEMAAQAHPEMRLRSVGMSQQGRPMMLATLGAQGRVDGSKPTVLIVAQQHGNEPAGGEAALALVNELLGSRSALLQRVNVLILPRANPDGAERFSRTTASGIDVNRDHLLLRTPEARAIAAVLREFQPQVMLDLHEFTVAGRWVEKFGVVQAYDALFQTASVGNLEPAIAAAASNEYEARLHRVLQAQGLTTFAYHTTSAAASDKVVSMGGVQPDTGRNTTGLRPALSLLIETRGIGIGRANYVRRVHTQVQAALTVIETAAAQGRALVQLTAQAQREAAARACQGELVIAARHSSTRMPMRFLDAQTGAARELEVDWRAAAPLQVDRSRARPCGYLIAGDQTTALETLRALGVRMQPVHQAGAWAVERYLVVEQRGGQRQDARGAIDDGADAGVLLLSVRTEVGREIVPPGHWWVGLDQPLTALISAALEPDSQSSFAANRLLLLDDKRLLRVMTMPAQSLLGSP
jgi:hypothetical protein